MIRRNDTSAWQYGLKPYTEKSILTWAVFVFMFLLAGVLGHDPWKQDETYSFGIIYHYYTTHSWLIPVNAGVPFMEKPPLYYWTAVLFCKLFAGLLPLHDAARLASVFYMAIACAALWATSQIAFQDYSQRRAMGWMTLALFLGCLGVARHAHDMFTDVALLAGASVALLGMVMLACTRQWIKAGMTLGLGIGIAFLSKGIGIPMILGLSGACLLLLLPRLRARNTFFAVLLAFFVASPFLFVWPCLLYRESPALFMEWFWNNNIGRFFGFSVGRLGAENNAGYMAIALLWFAFPVFPLACAGACLKRREWRTPEMLVPLAICVTGLAVLLLSASARALYLLPLLPAMALLAAQGLMCIPMRPLALWNKGVRILASGLAIIIVVMWLCLLHPAGPQPFSFLYGEWIPLGFAPTGSQRTAVILACLFAGAWSASFKMDVRPQASAAVLWFAAVALLWGLGNTLLLPWVNETRSFRPVVANINAVVSQPAYRSACIARHDLGESVMPMWEYFGEGRGAGPIEDFNGQSCPLLLRMTGRKSAALADDRWHLIWKGSRLFDGKDELQLFERNKQSSGL